MVVEFVRTAKEGRAKIEHIDTCLSRSFGLDELDVAVE
jgi:3-hydroxyacyl-CoA dehydrogenase